MASPIRWTNRAQPQTLQIAVFLLYFDAIISAVLGGLGAGPFGLVMIAASAGAAWGIANERKWAYGLGIAVTAFPFITILIYRSILAMGVIGLMIAVAKLALLLHPESREYQRIWFK